MGKSLTTEEFIEKAKKVHGDIYDYSEVHYINAKTKVTIICKEHGEFQQVPDLHLRGSGCKLCGIKRRQVSDNLKYAGIFCDSANAVHGDLYDYSKVEYTTAKEKVIVICKDHGEFRVSPDNHITKGAGCPVCGRFKQNISRSMKFDDFVVNARNVHGSKYIYVSGKFVNASTKTIIICPKHGEFKQTPNKHLAGQGCVECGRERISSKKSYTTEDFIKKAKEVHGDTYDYSKVKYINSLTPVEIVCKEHGLFNQTPNAHISAKCGCTKCVLSYNCRLISRYLDSIGVNYVIEKRFDECRYKNPLPFDFYLPDFNMLIEFHGGQHYKFNEFFHRTKECFKACQNRDKIKKDWAIANGYNFVEIKYDEDIEKKLQELFPNMVDK